MRAGLMRHTLLIERPAPPNALGELGDAWVPFAHDVAAQKMRQSGSAQAKDSGPFAAYNDVFKIWYLPDLTEEMRVVEMRGNARGRMYRIDHIDNVDDKDFELRLYCVHISRNTHTGI